MDSNSHVELTLRDLKVIFRRRRKIVYGVTAVVVVLAALYCLFSTKRYESVGTIEVLSKSQDGLGLENLTGSGPSTDTDAVMQNINLQTQASILQSDSLALKTIEDLHLEDTEDFQPHWNPIGAVLGLFSPSGTADAPNASLEDSPQRRRRVLLVFSKRLTVKPVNGTRLLEISFLNPDPKIAAAVVNKLTQSLIDYSFQTRFDATNQASGWLSGQLNGLRQQSEQLQKQAAELESKSGVYTLGTLDGQGREQSYSGVMDQLQQASTALAQAEQNRILRGAIAHAADTGDAELLSGLAGNVSVGANLNNSFALLQTLRSQEASQEAALQQAETKFGQAYPKLNEIRGNIAGIQRSIQQEIGRIKARAKTDYDVATHAEADTRSHYDAVKGQADKLNSSSIEFTILKQEADESSKLYQELLKRFKEAGVLGGLKGSMISVVDPGRVSAKPKKPNVPLYLAAGLGGGLLLGLFACLIAESLDGSLHSVSGVHKIAGDGLIGVTPTFGKPFTGAGSGTPPPLIVIDDPQSPFADSLRAVRASILHHGAGEAAKVILVASSVAGEGKTIVAANLGILLAQAGKSVLLIDTDFRNGGLRSALHLSSGPGLSELLSGQAQAAEIVPMDSVPNLSILQAGGASAHSAELLASGSLARWLAAWRAKYDYVLLDSVSLIPSGVSSTLASLSDSTLLVVRSGLTEESQLSRSYKLLGRSGNHPVAVILNGLRSDEAGYSSYLG